MMGIINKKIKTLSNHIEKHTITKVGRKYLYSRYGEPINPFTENWDNMIILDACRYDTFAELNNLPGKLEYRFSPASGTMEWLQETVDNRKFHDTVYVTANPRVSRYEGQFYEIIPAWKTHWDEKLKVTPPEELAELTRQELKNHPNKRIVAHFMQPHIPFIGDFGQSEIGIYDGTTKGRDRALGNEYTANEEPYELLKRGELSSSVVKKSYRENLQLVLSTVEPLIHDLQGKTVVTSDHGEMFGEIGWPVPRRRYGHSLYTAAKALLKVPWLTYQKGKRRNIINDAPQQMDDEISDQKIEERLKYLGYR